MGEIYLIFYYFYILYLINCPIDINYNLYILNTLLLPIQYMKMNSSSSSSSFDDERLLTNAMVHIITNNNYIIRHYEDNEKARQYQGSVSRHKVLNRPQQLAHTNLFNDYFAENLRFIDEMFSYLNHCQSFVRLFRNTHRIVEPLHLIVATFSS